MKLILGSQSNNRQEVLRRAGITFEVITADIDEKAIRTDDYEQLPLLIARAKADALIGRLAEPVLLVTADTVTVFADVLQEKPETPEQAREFLAAYTQTEPIKVITAVTVTNTATGQRADGVDIVILGIAQLPSPLIDELVNDPVTHTLAGGFTVYDERLEPYLAILPGTLESVAGLPLGLMRQLIAQVTA